MPFTGYHFGPSGFLGLLFRKWLDLPVFVLANLVVDIEVLYFHDWPVHRYEHTLLLGAVVGAAWGLSAYPLRSFFRKIMRFLRLPYETSLPKMLISGVLGVWLHVLIDGIYHPDVRLFWPNKQISLWRMAADHIGYQRMQVVKELIDIGCIILLVAAVLLYVFVLRAGKDKSSLPTSRADT